MFLSLKKVEKLKIDWPDVYFHPTYGKAVQESDGGKWECYYIPNEFIYVYLIKDTCITALYGYAGMYIYPNVSQDRYNTLRTEFIRAAVSRGYKSEFLRKNPYLSTFNVNDMELYASKKTFGMDLVDYNIYWSMTSSNHRNMVRKAERAGYTFTFDKVKPGDLNATGVFRTMYNSTMDSVNASDYYYFNNAYFDQVEKIPTVYIATVFSDKPVGCALFFVYKNYIHYHLSANTRDSNCITDFLLNRVIEYCLSHLPDVNIIHLGGGITDNDHLARFKQRICPNEYNYEIFKRLLY